MTTFLPNNDDTTTTVSGPTSFRNICGKDTSISQSLSRSLIDTDTNTPTAPVGSLRERDNKFYSLVAGAAKTKMLEAFIEFKIGELIGASETSSLSASTIIQKCGLDPKRGWKLLHGLSLIEILEEQGGTFGDEEETVYSLSADAKAFFGPKGTDGYFFREMLYWQKVVTTDVQVPFRDVLLGASLPPQPEWPPENAFAAAWVEQWMISSSAGPISTIVNSDALAGVKRLLDVGGGDGCVTAGVVDAYRASGRAPELHATVFNLPSVAALARQRIANTGHGHCMDVHQGDFLKDNLPSGYDAVMFSRVLTDWDAEHVRLILGKAVKALAPGGKIIINEAFLDGNRDYCTAWEFRYIFYDTFGKATFKPVSTYREILESLGMRVLKVTPMTDQAFYSVLEAVVA